MANEKEKFELVDVTSLKDLQFDGIAVQMDLTEDAWEYGAPPPHDIYDLKLFFAKDAWKQGRQSKDEKDIFLQANLECRIVSDNEDYNNVPVFGRADTRVFRSKTISTMAGLLVALGFGKTLEKLGGNIAPKILAQYFEAAMKKEPVIKAELDWKGSYKWTDTKGVEKWENAFTTYMGFPEADDKKGRKHIVMHNSKGGGMVEVRAQLEIKRFFAKGATLPVIGKVVAGSGGLVSQPRLVPKSQVKEEEVTLVQPIKVTPVPQMVSPAVVNMIDESDLELLLQD